jgi:hypothetical protein
VTFGRDWLARIGAPIDEAWFGAAVVHESSGTVRGRARDPAIADLAVEVTDGHVRRLHLDLAGPMPSGQLFDEFGPGQTLYAPDSTYETIVWQLGRSTVAADVDHRGVIRLSMSGELAAQ